MAARARVGILTNGLEFRLYTDTAKPNIMDEQPFLEIDILNLDKQQVGVLEGFTKARFDEVSTIQYIRLRARVFRELSRPSDWLVKQLIWKIREWPKGQTVLDEYRPLVERAIIDYVRAADDADSPLPPPPPEFDIPKPHTLLDGSVQIPVFATWTDHDFGATLRLRGKIANVGKIVFWDGEWLNPLSASVAATKTAAPNAEADVKGMTFWHFRDPLPNKLRPIIDLCHGWRDDWDLIVRVIRDANQ